MTLALITGASAGLGAEFAKLFVEDGHDVVLVARRKEKLDDIARVLKTLRNGVKVSVIEQDLGRPGAGVELFAKMQELRLPHPDFLVNNAGFGTSGKFWEIDPIKEMELIDLNVRTLVELCRLFLPAMIARGSGRVLNIGSMAGFQPGPFMANYYASKAYVNSFSEALAEELKGSGVTCTLLAPGATRTEFFDAAGMKSSRLSKVVVEAVPVVKAGYKGMMAGKPLVIPGAMNKSQLQTLRFAPRGLVKKISGYLNRAGK
jgi:short-subunit dehydrogenase